MQFYVQRHLEKVGSYIMLILEPASWSSCELRDLRVLRNTVKFSKNNPDKNKTEILFLSNNYEQARSV